MGIGQVNVTIGGEAGQGLVTIGQLFAKSLVRSGYDLLVTQSYMSRIRGGHNTYTIHVGTVPIAAPSEQIDMLVALNLETIDVHRKELTPHSLVIVDAELNVGGYTCLRVPFHRLAESRYHNIVALGVLGAVLGVDGAILTETVRSAFGKKKPELEAKNLKALEDAYHWALQQVVDGYRLPDVPKGARRLLLNGNEAIALGAMSAGLKFCAFYPMTPSTSVPLALAAWAKQGGIVVEQAEDEIAAINMAIGASYAGAPGMVATSGGGFALMTEGVSLAGMMEIPVVIVVAQRPGPATGLPTRTEQGDLEFVLHAGHGEFPRVILAPGSVEDCFHLTRKAFDLATRYQGPTFVLTDQYLADQYIPVVPFDLASLPPAQAGWDPASVDTPYKRYRFTENGVSPLLIPGKSKHLVIVDSDEHCEYGHITEDLEIRRLMVEKRLRKGSGITNEIIPPHHEGDDHPDLLLMAWGSTRGAVAEATRRLRSEGVSVAHLHFSQVWPMAAEGVLSYLERATEVVCVEGNATGQFARLVRRETGFQAHRLVLRYDGLPITPRYVLDGLKQRQPATKGAITHP